MGVLSDDFAGDLQGEFYQEEAGYGNALQISAFAGSIRYRCNGCDERYKDSVFGAPFSA